MAQLDTLVVGTTWTDQLPSEQVAVTGFVGDIAFSSRRKAVDNAWQLTQQQVGPKGTVAYQGEPLEDQSFARSPASRASSLSNFWLKACLRSRSNERFLRSNWNRSVRIELTR